VGRVTHDLLLAAGWCALLAVALAGAVIARRRGVPVTYLRDALHIGAGSWVIGWPWWRSPVLPIAIVLTAVVVVTAIPFLRRRVRLAKAVMKSMSGGDERWAGIILYAISFAVLTPVGLLLAPVPAGAALLALTLGDGIGGFVGRRFGFVRFAVPGGKAKTLEGSLAVGAAATVGVAIAGFWLGDGLKPEVAVVAGGIAALVEAVSPRGTDNVSLPAAVAAWIAL
jgi:phytol kinase